MTLRVHASANMVEITRLRIFRRSVQILCAVGLVLSISAILSAPDRDTWQRPDEVMDAMEAHLGSTVADVGAGEGWFTRIAQRVGATGTVFAVDVQPAMVHGRGDSALVG
jgi:predicted methyltransferase